jgi:beta-glucosidase
LKSVAQIVFAVSVAVTLPRLAQADVVAGVSTDSISDSAPPQPGKKAPPPPADVPTMRLDHHGQPDLGVMHQHELYLARGRSGPIDLLFIGDSITFNFIGNFGKDVWKKYYGAMKVANFGVGGDRTQNVLWRIDNGELDGISPKVVVLLIGTNNISAHNTPDEILKGETKIVDEIHGKLPNSRLIIIGVLPRAAAYEGSVKAINTGLAKLDDGNKTRFLDVGLKFQLPDDMTKDWVHINEGGYEVWAATMQPLLDQMMK